jgi:hypothetical protein
MGSHTRLKIIMPEEAATRPVSVAKAVSRFELRPLAQVNRIALFEREVIEHLSQAALDAVFAHAQVLSEGEVSGLQSKRVFLGSTMLTCEMADLAKILREPADEGTARHLALLLVKEPSLGQRTQAIVQREVERITRVRPKSVRGETRIRSQGTRIFFDIDVEAAL